MKLSFAILEILIGFLFQVGVKADSEGIRGTPGVDYPTFFEIPVTSFRCSDQKYTPGFYADPETGCQVFHYCYNNRQESYLCPTGTIFNQAILACDYWYSSDCVGAKSLYSVNNNYQSRALNTDFGDDGTSGDFGIDAKTSSELITSNVHYEALNVMPTDKDENKLNKVISSLENILPEKLSDEADEKHKLNIAANDNLHENKENAKGPKFLELPSQTGDKVEETSVLDNTKTVDQYDRYPQSVATSGPASPPLTNISGSVFEKLADLQDANLRLTKRESDQEYTEEQLRGLIEEIRDYEHEIHSGKDPNYMFRPYYLEKDPEDDFSDLNESEFNSKLTENSNYDYSKINTQDGFDKLVPGIEYDYDDSNANEDRLRYLHNLRVRDLHVSYSSNLKQDSTELNFSEDSTQKSDLPNDGANIHEESFQDSDDTEIFSKRQSVTEKNQNKMSRRDPIYIVPEVAKEAPKFLPKKKRQRGYPFGIQKTDVENPIATEANVGNITLNPAVEETENRVVSSPESPFDIESLSAYTDQTENQNVPSGEDYVSETEYNEAMHASQGKVHETAAASADELSDNFQYQNSYVLEASEYDYPQNDFSDFESQEHPGSSRIEYLREGLPLEQEYGSPLFETNIKNIPESIQGEYFSRREYSGAGFDTFDYSNTLSQLNKNQRNMYYPEVYSEKEDMYANSEQTYQEELEKRNPTYSSDAYTNFNINRDEGNEKVIGSFHENAYRGKISGTDFENIQDQDADEMTAELDLDSSEQNDESSLRDEKYRSQDSEIFSEYNFSNNPQNMYMDPEGNLFYYVESEVIQSPENMYGVTQNDAELYLNINRFSDTDMVNSSLLKKNTFERGHNSDSDILEDKPDSLSEEAYSKNIKKVHESYFNEFFTSQEFSETNISSIQDNEDDSVMENDKAGPYFPTEEQNEYKDDLNEDSFQEEIEESQISSGDDYELRNRPQNIYRDLEGNMFYYVDTEMPQAPESDVPANDFEFQVDNMNSSRIGAADSDLLFGSTGGLQSDRHIPVGEADKVSGETYAQNIMKIPGYNDYGNPPNIYRDSAGNMFYYINTELPEDSGDSAGGLNAMASDPFSSDFSWSAEGRNFPLSHPENGQPIIDPEETYVENIMKMSDAEIQEYINSQSSEANDIPDTQNSKYYAKDNRKKLLANKDITSFEDNMGDTGEFRDTAQKWPNRFELLDSYAGISEESFPDQYTNRGEDFSEDILQKRVEKDFEEGSSEENNDFVNSLNTGSSGNRFYNPEIMMGGENFENKPHTMSKDALDPDFPPENTFSGGRKGTETDELHGSLDEALAKQIMEMSDTEFEEYLKSQGLTQELLYEQQKEDSSSINEEGLQQDGSESQDYDEPGQEYDIRNNPQNIYVDSQGNMYYYAVDSEVSNDPEDFDSEAESNLENVINSNSNESSLPLENGFADSTNLSSNILEETETDPAAEEAYLKNIMKMSDEEFRVYLNSQEFKDATDIPDILADENKPDSGEKDSENQWSPVQDSMEGFQSSHEIEESIRTESSDSQFKGKVDSIQELNKFESGAVPLAETSGLSEGINDSRDLKDASHIDGDSTNKQILEPLPSKAAVESIDVNKEAEDELYGDFSDLFAALAKDPGVKDQETKDNLKLESAIVQEKIKTGNTLEGSLNSKLPGKDFNEQMAFKPLEQPSSSLVKGFRANSIPPNLKSGDEKHFSEFPQYTQGFNSFQLHGASPYQQHASSQPVLKKSTIQPKKVDYKPSQIREPTFGGTLRSMKNSKLQMLRLYAKALRQRLF